MVLPTRGVYVIIQETAGLQLRLPWKKCTDAADTVSGSNAAKLWVPPRSFAVYSVPLSPSVYNLMGEKATITAL